MRPKLPAVVTINSALLTAGIALAAIVVLFLEVPVLELIELKTYDVRFQSREVAAPRPTVALALIDEKSLNTEGRWPWPRSKIARLVDRLAEDGARVIGFDVGFLEPDENSQLEFIRELRRMVEQSASRDDRLLGAIRGYEEQADNDLALAAAIRRSPAAVVLGYFFQMSSADLEYTIDPGEINRRLDLVRPSYPFTLYADPQAQAVPFIRAYAPESNLAILSESAGSAGFYNVRSDPDGVVRWMPLVIQCGERIYPPLALVCAWQHLGRPKLVVEVDRYGIRGVRVGERTIPTDESGQLLINFLGPAKTFPHYSISDILAGQTPRGTFAGRIVLVGSTTIGSDLRSTPVGPVFPGAEIQATALENILTGDSMAKPRWSRIYDLAAIVLLCSAVGLALPRLGALKAMAFTGMLFALHVLVAYWLFAAHRVWLNMVIPLLALVLTYSILTAYRYVTEQRERRQIRDAFSRYVAPEVIDKMLADPGRLQLGGEEKDLTVLFSDLWGFTGYAERYSPQEMVSFLSEYFERMSVKIFLYHGTLKEYVGDELMAIFGAPLDQPDHAVRACTAALDMRRELARIRDEWTRAGRPALRARMGINSGPMLVGNLGSRYRFAYGVLGDNVNLGSRLEGLNREYGTDILVGENTVRQVGDAFRLRELDLVRVLGRSRPERIYELVSPAGDVLPGEMEEALQAYAAGLDRYRAQAWQDAIALFERAASITPNDGASKTLLRRCQLYQRGPLAPAWDGVFEVSTK